MFNNMLNNFYFITLFDSINKYIIILHEKEINILNKKLFLNNINSYPIF